MTPDYIVIGSGAGGGPLAARLAEGGATVVVLEAGGDPRAAQPGRDPAADYDVPAFHPFASENPATAWNFAVDHYADPARAARDPKQLPGGGILYPRAGTLGGCTAHHAMIHMNAHDSDWDGIAALTGDASWSADEMWRWFARLEDCRYRPLRRWLAQLGIGGTGHGWDGWLPTALAMPAKALGDRALLGAMGIAAVAALRRMPQWRAALGRLLTARADPGDRRTDGTEGVWMTPVTTRGHVRCGARDRLLAVAARHPERLRIELDALATRVIIEDGRATGVEYLRGARLYGATPGASDAPGEPRRLAAGKGVIVAGGAFNTPQLLMLSGIGERAHLAAHGIECVADLPEVGRNLQDRYEVGVVFRMTKPWAALRAARFEAGDPLHAEWTSTKTGMYVSNGSALAVTRRSSVADRDPDTLLMALLARFEGYAPGYAQAIADTKDCLTWCVLKAHTRNRAGTVRLASADPRTPPKIDFAYFAQGGAEDRTAVAEAVAAARAIAAPLAARGLVAEELTPGAHVTGAALDRWIEDHAWGHHACGTAAIGPVLDGALRVRGVAGLRVVDASVFPRIPGYFIACPTYMIAEKTAAAMLGE